MLKLRDLIVLHNQQGLHALVDMKGEYVVAMSGKRTITSAWPSAAAAKSVIGAMPEVRTKEVCLGDLIEELKARQIKGIAWNLNASDKDTKDIEAKIVWLDE